MHYWPAGGPSFGCDTDSGFRTSAPDKVTCPDCLTGLAAGVPVTVTAVEIIDGVEVPIGEPRQTTTSRGALDLLHGSEPRGAGRGWPYERYEPAPVPVPDRRYDCGGCSFATVDRARMLGHFHATGHTTAPAMQIEPMTEAAADRVARAYNAWRHDDSGGPGAAAGVIAAVEVARTVELTPAVERALYAALAAAEPGQHHAAARVGLLAVFEVLGLRVVES